MARDYTYDTGQHDSRRAGLNLFDFILAPVTIFFTVLLLLSYLARWVDPNTMWLLALTGLVAPILYLVTVLLFLYWVLRWKWWALVPLVALLLGASSVKLFFRPSIRRHYEIAAQVKAPLTIASYNVEGFIVRGKDNVVRITADSIASLIEPYQPDILCMQEFQTTPRLPQYRLDTLLAWLPYRAVHYSITLGDNAGWGVAIYSRYPIVRSHEIEFDGSSNSAIWADVVMGRDTLRIFDCHLQTTSLTQSDRIFITDEFIRSGNEVKKRKVRNIIGKLRSNYRIRAAQADTIRTLLDTSPYPVILCGDFNDTPLSYTYHRVRGSLSDAFTEKGRGMANTYKGFFNLFRIDYVFHGPQFTATNYDTPDSDISDHKPVVVGLQPVEKK